MFNKSKKHKALKSIITVAFGLTIIITCCVSCNLFGSDNNQNNNDSNATDQTQDINSVKVTDKKSLYDDDVDYRVVAMYLTIRTGNSSDNTDHTWEQINSHSNYYYEENDIDKYKSECILQVGDENGPLPDKLGYGLNVPNATIQVRGATSSKAEQKSFKISIKSSNGDWNGQKTIALNKHPYDGTRFLNKLGYDLIKSVPDMISLRTQFVHLYVKDQTGDNVGNNSFTDYGLFTQVEQVNTRYLRNHGLDESGQLYKATMFEFYKYEDVLKLKSDPTYNQKEFEKILEIKGNDDHSKLINMLNDLNNYSIPIEDLINKYFDEDNYFTWLAYQMLTGNTDTTSQNFFLYSPQNSIKWYFISWDNDGAFLRSNQVVTDGSYDYCYDGGISNYWGSILHKRVIKSDTYRQKLDEKVEYIKSYITKEKIAAKINEYKSVIGKYSYAMPDLMHVKYDLTTFNKLLEILPNEIDYNYDLYKKSLTQPMPFYMDAIRNEDGKLKYSWDVSYDLNDENLTYKIQISNDFNFNSVLYEGDNLLIPQFESPTLKTGQYFIKLTVTNESGASQTAMEYYQDLNDVKHYGVIMFYVLPDGSISTTGE